MLGTTGLCKKGTVLLSTSLAWPALAGCSKAETFSQLSAIYFSQPCTYFSLGFPRRPDRQPDLPFSDSFEAPKQLVVGSLYRSLECRNWGAGQTKWLRRPLAKFFYPILTDVSAYSNIVNIHIRLCCCKWKVSFEKGLPMRPKDLRKYT